MCLSGTKPLGGGAFASAGVIRNSRDLNYHEIFFDCEPRKVPASGGLDNKRGPTR